MGGQRFKNIYLAILKIFEEVLNIKIKITRNFYSGRDSIKLRKSCILN